MKRYKVLFLIVFAVLFFAIPKANSASVGSVLKDALSGKRPLADLNFTYQAGSPGLQGQTSITLDGNGDAVLTSNKGGKKDIYKGKVSPQGIKTILDIMTKDKVWSAKAPKKPYVVDSSIVKIGISTKQKDLNTTIEFLETKAMMDKKTQGTYLTFRALMKKMSNGKVKY